MSLTLDRLQELLSYNPETGIFLWKKTRPGGKGIEGQVAGKLHNSGYWYMCVDGHRHGGHRLAWFYTYGVWPQNTIDHINLNKIDNKINNLREATHQQNCCNRNNSRTKFKGTGANARGKPFSAFVQINGKKKTIGRFDTREEAHAAYCAAAAIHYGEFARAA